MVTIHRIEVSCKDAPKLWETHAEWLERYLGKSSCNGPINDDHFRDISGLWSVFLDPFSEILTYRIKDNPDIAALFKLTWA